jgi:biopolymer transport protein ExbB
VLKIIFAINNNKKQIKKNKQVMAEQKTAAIANAGGAKSSNTFMWNLGIVGVCILVAVLLFMFVLGDKSNFIGTGEHAKPANFFGTMYKGGAIVPLLIACALILITFIVERFITVFKSRGSMSNADFVRQVQYNLANKNLDGAIAVCDKQRGSVGNVMKSGLKKYKEMSGASGMNQDQKIAIIQKEVEEATALELPMLEKNLVFLSTIASVATLLGLLGTVKGMITAFQAMGQSGAPDANALATGISEALVNTALGIGTSFVAIIAYNFFTTIIDQVTHGIDESGFTLSQSFKANYPA